MKSSRIGKITLYILIAIQVASFGVAVSSHRLEGRAVYRAYVKYVSDPTQEGEAEFHREMGRLQENEHRVRLYGIGVFVVNGALLIAVAARLRRTSKTGP